MNFASSDNQINFQDLDPTVDEISILLSQKCHNQMWNFKKYSKPKLIFIFSFNSDFT